MRIVLSMAVFILSMGTCSATTSCIDLLIGGEREFDGYTGLSDIQKVSSLLATQEYTEVIKYLWSETDRTKRLQWLQQTALEGHVICMLELSKEYALQSDVHQSDVHQSFVWYELASVRLNQDMRCCAVSREISCASLITVYSKYLKAALIDNSICSESALLALTKQCVKEAYDLLLTWKHYPSPGWLLENAGLKPEHEWPTIRQKVCDEYADQYHFWKHVRTLEDQEKMFRYLR